ncbi:hypothetical protein M9H77_37253 [Catharanthus roseus]|uniref:Uncharacterized protein n=1 Tax=Catharanthus roseus TaxID=4058 RepID=A0ACB9ZW29_CATRO|nr:hypothetical protein M9H77_37253 [Catharanthus roseus]
MNQQVELRRPNDAHCNRERGSRRKGVLGPVHLYLHSPPGVRQSDRDFVGEGFYLSVSRLVIKTRKQGNGKRQGVNGENGGGVVAKWISPGIGQSNGVPEGEGFRLWYQEEKEMECPHRRSLVGFRAAELVPRANSPRLLSHHDLYLALGRNRIWHPPHIWTWAFVATTLSSYHVMSCHVRYHAD